MKRQDDTNNKAVSPMGFQAGLVADGFFVGAAAAAVSVVYRFLLGKAEAILFTAVDFLREKPAMAAGWLLLMFGISWVCKKLHAIEPMIAGSGIPQVAGELKGHLDVRPARAIISKMIGGTLCIVGGMSLGREGPSVQLGAMSGKLVSKAFGRDSAREKMLVTCGAGAGLAAAFNAPLSGVIFALEELHKKFDGFLLACVMAGAVTADYISKIFFGTGTVFCYELGAKLPLRYYWLLVLFGVALGMLGAVYNRLMLWGQDFFEKLEFLPREIRLMIPFCMGLALMFFFPETLAGGHAMAELLEGGKVAVSMMILLFLLKFGFSVFCFGSGAPGGIFFPLLILGSYAGAVFGNGVALIFHMPETMVYHFVVLAMAGFFAAIVRAPVTGVVLIAEMTGSLEHLISLLLVSAVACAVANGLNSPPIYESLLDRILLKNGK